MSDSRARAVADIAVSAIDQTIDAASLITATHEVSPDASLDHTVLVGA